MEWAPQVASVVSQQALTAARGRCAAAPWGASRWLPLTAECLPAVTAGAHLEGAVKGAHLVVVVQDAAVEVAVVEGAAALGLHISGAVIWRREGRSGAGGVKAPTTLGVFPGCSTASRFSHMGMAPLPREGGNAGGIAARRTCVANLAAGGLSGRRGGQYHGKGDGTGREGEAGGAGAGHGCGRAGVGATGRWCGPGRGLSESAVGVLL